MLPLALSLLGCAKPTPIAERSSSGTGPEFLSCPTCGRSTSPPRESTCFTAATPVSRSALPGSARERTIRGISGPSSPDAFAFYDPDLLSLRMSQATLLSDSTGCSLTLPKWGLLCGGALYELPTPALLTNGHGSSGLLGTPSAADAMGGHLSRGGNRSHELLLKGQVKALLPTPVAQEPGGTAEAHLHRKNRLDGANRVTPTHLAFIERLLPTPAVNDMGAGKTPQAWDEWTDRMREQHRNGNGHGRSLAIEAQRLLPTPSASDSTGGEGPTREARQAEGQTGGPMLRDVGHLLPTPTAMDSKASGGSTPSDVTPTDAVVRTSLGASTNPRFGDGNTSSDEPHPGQLTIEDA